MSVIYTGRDIRTKLAADPNHGAMYAFALKEFDQRGFTLGVTDTGLFGNKYEVTEHGITIDTGARDLDTAVSWAKNALREWAFQGMRNKGKSTYFAETARAWAKDKKSSFPNCMGSTVDFLYLFSRDSAPADSRTNDMYYVRDYSDERSLAQLYLWVFVDWWTPVGQTEDHVMVHPDLKDLHPDFLDSLDSTADQSHHYAFYFWVGVTVGVGETRMSEFLEKTHDLDEKWKKILNKGDYYLGYLAARHGQSLDDKSRFMGSQIETDLKNPFPDKNSLPQVALHRIPGDPWVNHEGDVSHPGSPAGIGGPGRFALARIPSFERTELPHPNSPAARNVDPLDVYHYQRLADARARG